MRFLGIGKSIVEKLLADKQQPNVVGVSRSDTGLKELAEKYPNRFVYVTGDVSEDETSVKIVSKAISTFGKINGIVFNAGVLDPIAPIQEADLAAWKKLYGINFFAAVSLTSHALPEIRKTNGRLVYVSSDATTINFFGWAAYGSSKAALNHFVKTLASEEKGVFSVSIAPGIVDTNMQVNIRDSYHTGMTKEEHDMFKELKSSGKLLHPDVPASVLANLVLRGQGEINGNYYQYDNKELVNYQ